MAHDFTRHRSSTNWGVIGDGAGGYRVGRVSVSRPGPGEVAVALKASGVCHTDWDGLSTVEGPQVMGHEGAGIITEVGEGVSEFVPGQAVLLTWAIACHRCFQCQRGNEVLCEALGRSPKGAAQAPTFDENGNTLGRYFNLGTMATSTVVRAEALVQIPEGIPFTSACLLGCAVMTGFGSVVNAAHVAPASTVAVIGCGGVGLNVIQGARISGARRIVAIDVDSSRADMARRLGATDFIQAQPDDTGLLRAAAEVADILGGREADYAFECTAIPELGAAPLSFVHDGGTAVQVSGIEQRITVDMKLFEWDKVYINPLYGKARPRVDFPILFDLYLSGTLLLDELVTSTYALADVGQAFADMHSHKNAKGVIVLE